jgi:predicted oxidoreductase
MAKLYFRAIITRIDSIGESMGVSMWEAMTDCGYAKFEVVDRQRHIRFLPGGRFLITDVDGNRYEIPCIYELDERSQRLVETET